MNSPHPRKEVMQTAWPIHHTSEQDSTYEWSQQHHKKHQYSSEFGNELPTKKSWRHNRERAHPGSDEHHNKIRRHGMLLRKTFRRSIVRDFRMTQNSSTTLAFLGVLFARVL